MHKAVHPTAIVDEGAQIGAGTRVWHWAHICGGARIGERCSFGQNVFVGNDVLIGDNVKVQNNVSIYDAVTLEDDVFCGPSMVFTNVYNPRSAVTRKDEYRRTLIRKGTTLGANCTIVCGVTVGEYAFIGAGAVINKDVKPYALMVGVPARQIGWMSEHGEQIPLPLQGDGSYRCPHTGSIYTLKDGQLGKTGALHASLNDEIETQTPYNLPPEVYERARAMREKFDAILNAPPPPDYELPELTEKQLERIAAFELREDR